ncbi:MAG: hypothetical protein ACM3TN_12005 [Alphaproteobacteria bacterium]
MGCIRSLSRTWARFAVELAVTAYITFPATAWAAFASQFSLSVGEQYSDNIFFTKQKDHDFVTVISPALQLFYAPEGQVEPTGNLTLTSNGRIYARNTDLNNFGQDFSANGGYLYRYSPRLTFSFSDSLFRQGPARLGGYAPGFQTPGLPSTGGGVPSQNLKDLTSGGSELGNSVAFHGAFLYRPNISFTADFTNTFTNFISQGGTDVFTTASARGIYNWRQDHNLHVGYTISISNARNGDSCNIGKFDFGDDYFSNYNLQLTPTLSLSASTGLSINSGGGGCVGGPAINNSTHITVTKLWERAFLTGGMTKDLTPSYGVSGVSDTTSFFTNFTMRMTEKLTATSNFNFSLYDTKDVNFKTFQAGLGLQYAINSWLSANLNYYFNWNDGGAGASSTCNSNNNPSSCLITKGVVNSNNVFLSLTSHFDLWPNVGLARSMSLAAKTPTLATPFPTPTPPPPSEGTGTGTSPSSVPTP